VNTEPQPLAQDSHLFGSDSAFPGDTGGGPGGAEVVPITRKPSSQ